ncbi:MAG: YkgJ family cysteine cluster protein [Planctomycetota bacterium]|jgi:Fe-S-cluster containining protein
MAKGKKKPKGKKKKKKAPISEDFVLDDKCGKCPAMCCRYIALEIDTPEDSEDWDNLRWYLLHRNVSIYVTDEDWHLCVDVPCRYLNRNRCTIHESKPLLCRRHDPDECEFANPDYELDLEFRSWEDLKAYMKKKGLTKFMVTK